MEAILNIQNLSKSFGKIQAVDNLNLNIEQGQVYGLLGPNGSGKTTTLGMVLDVVTPDSGSIKWFGKEPSAEMRRSIGSILETPCFYPYLSAYKNLKIAAHIKEVNPDRIDIVLEKVGLLSRKNDVFKAYSLGMKQRLSIASALLADPPVLILDEPTNGLDPQGIAEIRNLILEIASQGKTIIIASHLLDEVQKICSNFCVLRQGKKLYEGSVASILNETNIYEISTGCDDILQKVLSDHPKITNIISENKYLVITTTEKTDAAALNQYCFDKGLTLTHLVNRRNSLESEFLKILKDND